MNSNTHYSKYSELRDILTEEDYQVISNSLESGEEIPEDLFTKLYNYYLNNGEMPYGVAKARDGDPYNWIADRIWEEFGPEGVIR